MSKRCLSCGFLNRPELTHCIKCNSPLPDQAPASEDGRKTVQNINPGQQPASPQQDNIDPARTIRQSESNDSSRKTVADASQSYHQEVPQEHSEVIKKQHRARTPQQTVNIYASKQKKTNQESFILEPISEEATQPIEFTTDDNLFTLNRESLNEEENQSISGSAHANIYHVDGTWFINNKTSSGTTFKMVRSTEKLEDGDIILLGDKLYQFKVK